MHAGLLVPVMVHVNLHPSPNAMMACICYGALTMLT